jgi:hypothetical protein
MEAKMKKLIYVFFILFIWTTSGFCKSIGSDDSLLKTEDITIEQIKNDNKKALKAIENSLKLFKQLAEGKFNKSEDKSEVDKIFDELVNEIAKTLEGIDDQSELMKYVIQQTQNIRVKMNRYKGKDEQKFWIELNAKLKRKVKDIHNNREDIGIVLGKLVKEKYYIYQKIERKNVKKAVDSLDSLTNSLKALKESLSKVIKMPDVNYDSAPAN